MCDDCHAGGGGSEQPAQFAPLIVSGSNLRTYRLACAATAEYTAFQGGTVPLAMAALIPWRWPLITPIIHSSPPALMPHLEDTDHRPP